MSFSVYRTKVFLLLGVLLLGRAAPFRASIPTQTQVVLIGVGIGVIGAGIGITAYHFAHKSPSLTGCTTSASGALMLQNESDHQNFTLVGNISALTAGERVRITGKKQTSSGSSIFMVEKVRKDYRACTVTTTQP